MLNDVTLEQAPRQAVSVLPKLPNCQNLLGLMSEGVQGQPEMTNMWDSSLTLLRWHLVSLSFLKGEKGCGCRGLLAAHPGIPVPAPLLPRGELLLCSVVTAGAPGQAVTLLLRGPCRAWHSWAVSSSPSAEETAK